MDGGREWIISHNGEPTGTIEIAKGGRMIKYYHELTKEEFSALVDKGITYEELMRDYPQPKWCSYPGATEGVMGCWSLVDFDYPISRKYCKGCDCYIKRKYIKSR